MSSQQKQAKATKLADVGRFARPEPLNPETWGQYVDTDQARGSVEVQKLIEMLKDAHRDKIPLRAVFAGHRGCGKSTELARVSNAVRELYAGAICRVEDRYALPTLDYRQLLFLCADVLMKYAQGCRVDLSDDQVQSLSAWFDDATIKEVKTSGHKVEGEAGVNLGYLTLLFAKFSGKIYSGGETQATVTHHIERRLDQLVQNMRIVVTAIEEKIAPHRLLLILEGLDKIEPLKQSRDIFIDHRIQLLSIPCSVIFTFPIRLWYEPDGGIEGYDDRFLLPMIPVAEAPASADLSAEEARKKAHQGRQVLRDIVHARLEASLIAEDALDYLVQTSGGVIRDLLYMLRDAALNAQRINRQKIIMEDCRKASRRLRDDYAKHLSAGADVKVEDILKTLGKPAEWPRRQSAPNAAFKLLLQSLCILEYNGDTWYDLHPLIRWHLEITLADEERRAKLGAASQ